MYVLQVHGDLELSGSDHKEAKIYAGSDTDVSVQLSINEDGDQPVKRCANCGEESTDDEPDEGECPGSGECGTCPTCNGTGDCQGCLEHVECCGPIEDCDDCSGSQQCPECGDGQIEIHDWESIPLTWCNSASIHAEPDGNRVWVTLSVDDPRGAFVMYVEQDSDGQLWLHVPHADMSLPHAPLTQRGPGWFKVR